ncbi:MAG: hypothetical protein ACRDC4_01580 [Plesiomonas sp.]
MSGKAWKVVVTIDKVAGLAVGTTDAGDKPEEAEVAGAMSALKEIQCNAADEESSHIIVNSCNKKNFYLFVQVCSCDKC